METTAASFELESDKIVSFKNLINIRDPLLELGDKIDWVTLVARINGIFESKQRSVKVNKASHSFIINLKKFDDKNEFIIPLDPSGRNRLNIRMMVALTIHKYKENLSDRDVVRDYAKNFYLQYFTGKGYFKNEPPCDPSSLGNFRRDIGVEGCQAIHDAIVDYAAINHINPEDFADTIVDSTVENKRVAYPRDIVLVYKCIVILLKYVEYYNIDVKGKDFISLRSKKIMKKYNFISSKEESSIMEQKEKYLSELKEFLRSLIVLVGNFTTTMPPSNDHLELVRDLYLFYRVYLQNKFTPGSEKVYSVDAIEVEAITKGKFKVKWEYGVLVGLLKLKCTNFFVACQTFPGKPYDSYTLKPLVAQANTSYSHSEKLQGIVIKEVTGDLHYRVAQKLNPEINVITRAKKDLTFEEIYALICRQAIEPGIGHLKTDFRMDKCMLKGAIGDSINALLSVVGSNVNWVLRAIEGKVKFKKFKEYVNANPHYFSTA